MCASWLANGSPQKIRKIELVYPITGHSFLPSDRVFELIEKDLKRKKTIIKPSEYYNVFSRLGTVQKINNDWLPYNWKKVVETNLRKVSLLNFKMQKNNTEQTREGSVVVKGELA